MPTLAKLATGESVDQLVDELTTTNAKRVKLSQRIGAEIIGREHSYTFSKETFLAAASGETSPPKEVLQHLREQLATIDCAHENAPVILSDSLGLRAIGRLALFSEENTLFPRYKFNLAMLMTVSSFGVRT